MEKLKKKLISIGGDTVAGTSNEEEKILKRGQVLSNKNVLVRKMVRSSCHYNSAQLVIDHNKSGYKGELQMWTGWALSSDGIWREHSWVMADDDSKLFPMGSKHDKYKETVVKSGTLIETTESREIYFGYPISGEEFDRTAHHQGAF